MFPGASRVGKVGEMSEWLKEHAWKAVRWSDAETYEASLSQPLQRLTTGKMSLDVSP